MKILIEPGATLISLEDERVRGLTTNLPVFAPGQPISAVLIPDVSDKTSGVWSLWRVSLHTAEGREQRYHALFLTEDGRVFGPTARTIWDRLIDLPNDLSQAGPDLSGTMALDAYQASRKAAEAQGATVFEELVSDHRLSIVRERKKGIHAFSSRRRAIERLGLPQVRAHRLRILGDEEQAWTRDRGAGSRAPGSRRRPHGSRGSDGSQRMSTPLPSSTWREPILAQFTPDIASVARLTVVADPDELLTEQGIVDGIRQRGFEIVPFEDHVAFRYAYERRFREVWDDGNDTNLVVVLRAARSDISGLPFDLLQQAKRDRRLLSFSLAELFPSLAPHVLSDLDRADLDAVSAAQQLFKPEPLGENATRDFLLRTVFRLDPAQIQSDAELLRALLRRHYSSKVVPKTLDDRLIYLLRSTGRWQDWPLNQIVPSRASFLEFLQERWPIFLRRTLDAQADGPA